MKKRFIILIDLSEDSANLLQYAFDWSRRANAGLLLVHQNEVVVPGLSDSQSREMIAQNANREALNKLKKFKNKVLPQDLKVSYHVSEEPLQLTLKKLLSELYEHLIFVGLKGTGLLKKIFIGSVAVQVINETDEIVVAMPKNISRLSQEKIFVAVPEKQPLNVVELNNVLEFLGSGVESITFFYLAKSLEETGAIEKQLRGLKKLFDPRYPITSVIYKGNSSFGDIKKVINNQVDELLIVQKGSRLLTDQFFRKFVINELVYEGETPLIVLP